MAGFNFERGLPHQLEAIDSIMKVFHDVKATKLQNKMMANLSNPLIKCGGNDFIVNLDKVQKHNGIDKKHRNKNSNIFDISMETGTGKTYTYAKMMFELHKNLKISKFIVIVPTLSIKAGTINFLEAKATKEHFRQEYGTDIKTYIVESKKAKKNKKEYMPQAVRDFVEVNTSVGNKIHILIINAGMINSETMLKDNYTINLIDKYSSPYEAISAINPITIVDEPHKFAKGKVTWTNIEKFGSQWIYRYGATFEESKTTKKHDNLLYNLSAVDAFNNDLVKGITTYVEDFNDGQNSLVTLISLDGVEANFELNINGVKTRHKLAKKDSMSLIHNEMRDLSITEMNKSKLVLSNGVEMKPKSKINPYSYSQSIQDKMMQRAIKKHFELEKQLLTRESKIKPLTLFFIDDIEGYRDGHNIAGSLKTKFESMIKVEIEALLKIETKHFYREYLKKSLADLSITHGGYFSKDNTGSDEKVEKEINEILHDKESLLSLKNTRRFIFSKWTLREGWDNPNVFQICKLRSSGSTTSKLQEVGRGLRLPVNEYMSRVKGEKFDLHYYVDFTEREFTQTLIDEINNKSDVKVLDKPIKLNELLIEKILKEYDQYKDDDALCEYLVENGIISFSQKFKEDGYDKLKDLFPKIIEVEDGIKGGKVKNANDVKKKVNFRAGKYEQLKELWEAINQKVVLEYKINEDKFQELLKDYFLENLSKFKPQGILTKTQKVEFDGSEAFYRDIESLEDEILPVVTMTYKAFLIELATIININLNTIHKVLVELKEKLNINQYLNIQTIRSIKSGFNKFLLDNAISDFEVGYNTISNNIHPTKFTDEKGNAKINFNPSDLGVYHSEDRVGKNYLFDQLYYDSYLEKQNIEGNITAVTVFTKIPKNSIKIPVAGGGTYSPDFAYVIETDEGKKSLNLIVETKDKDKRSLFLDEEKKIEHAQLLFNSSSTGIDIQFKTQFNGELMTSIIKEALEV